MSEMSQHNQQQPAATQAIWRGKGAVCLANGSVGLTILERGCVLAEFGFTAPDGGVPANALWESPWFDETVDDPSDEALQRAYGDLGAGRFLNRFTGHALCLDGFGPVSEQELRAGSGLHGEATLVDWKFAPTAQDGLLATAHLPVAKLTAERTFSLRPDEVIVRVDERVTDRSDRGRSLHWVQHATIGPPMFDEASTITTSARQGITWPLAYGCEPSLQQSAQFTWPYAPLEMGGRCDLRSLFALRNSGFVAAARQPDERRHGFAAACNPATATALVYVYPKQSFPWIAFWEENRCRQEWPWSGRVQARGLEFGSTPLPLGTESIAAAGPVLQASTSHFLKAGATMRAPWAVAVVNTPPHWQAIEDVQVASDALILRSGADSLYLPARNLAAFFDEEDKNA